MSFSTAVSAFTHRSARPAMRVQLLGWSAGLVGGMVAIAAWLCSKAEEPPGGECSWSACPQVAPLGWNVLALADIFALSALAVGLLVLAPAAIAATVAAERRAGTLDQLRTTPLRPLALCAGLLVGAPARIHLLLVGPLALHLACGLLGVIPVPVLVASLAVLAAGGLASALFGMTAALAPQRESGGALVALAVAAVLGFGALAAAIAAQESTAAHWAFLHPGGALHAALLQHDGLWRRLLVSPWRLDRFAEDDYLATLGMTPLLSCLCSLALAAVLAGACCRRLAAAHRPLLGKGHALALFAGAVGAVLLPACAWIDRGNYWTDFAVLRLLLLFAPLAAALGVLSAPTAEAWAMALRRGGRRRFFDDDASPYGTMWLMAALLPGGFACGGWIAFVWSDPDAHLALVWAVGAFLSLPVFVHFLSTRYATPAARGAFGAAVLVHILGQAIGIAMTGDGHLHGAYVEAALVAAVAAPAWVAYRQIALRRRILAAGARS